jgi:hypothetical protein
MKVTFRKVAVRHARQAALTAGLYPDVNWEQTILYDETGLKIGTVANTSLEFVQRIISPQVDQIIGDVQVAAAGIADQLVDKFFNMIGHMMGDEGTPPELSEMGIAWKALDPRYAAMKRGTGFFVNTGKLRRQFYARSGLKVFGKSELLPIGKSSLTPNGLTVGTRVYGGIKMNSFGLRVMPILGALPSGSNFAARESLVYALGLSDEERRKLQGRVNYFRPLIGPALAYFFRKLLPTEIAKGLRKKGFTINSVS